jgi:hypothetical protein
MVFGGHETNSAGVGVTEFTFPTVAATLTAPGSSEVTVPSEATLATALLLVLQVIVPIDEEISDPPLVQPLPDTLPALQAISLY